MSQVQWIIGVPRNITNILGRIGDELLLGVAKTSSWNEGSSNSTSIEPLALQGWYQVVPNSSCNCSVV